MNLEYEGRYFLKGVKWLLRFGAARIIRIAGGGLGLFFIFIGLVGFIGPTAVESGEVISMQSRIVRNVPFLAGGILLLLPNHVLVQEKFYPWTFVCYSLFCGYLLLMLTPWDDRPGGIVGIITISVILLNMALFFYHLVNRRTKAHSGADA